MSDMQGDDVCECHLLTGELLAGMGLASSGEVEEGEEA